MVNQRLLSTHDGSIVHKSQKQILDEFNNRESQKKARQEHANSSISRRIKTWLSDNSAIYSLIKHNDQVRHYLSKTGLVGEIEKTPLIPDNNRLRHSYPPLVYASEKKPWINLAWKNHLNSFLLIKRYAATKKQKYMIVLIPSREQIYSYFRDNVSHDYEKPVKLVREFLLNNNIPYIDLHEKSLISIASRSLASKHIKNDFYYEKEPHWNKNGHAFAAKNIIKYLDNNNLLK